MNTTNTSESGKGADVSIDIQKWAFKLLSYWWLFLICLGISIPSGMIYLRYTNNEYAAKAKLLIEGAGGGSGLSELAILDGLGISGGGKSLINEIEILSSRPVVKKAVELAGVDVTYFRIGAIKNTELYNSAPFVLKSYEFAEGRDRFSFFVEIGYYQDFKFKKSADDPGLNQKLGETFKNDFGTFLISANDAATLVPGLYRVNISPSEDVAEYYKRKIEVQVVGAKGSNILEIILQDQSAEKAVAIVTALIESYNEIEIEEDTEILASTIEFIDKRVEVLETELKQIESGIEQFKSENNIITESASSSLGFALSELRNSIAQLSTYEIEQELLQSVSNDLINASGDDNLIPTNVAKTSPSLSSLIGEYNQTILKRKRLRKEVTSESPIIVELNNSLEDQKKLILLSMDNLLGELEIPIKKTEREIADLRKDLTNIPAVEQQLLEKIRMQTIKENLYLYLLQKKEETELSRAITTAKTRLIERAKSGGSVYPRKNLIRMGSILLGISVPILLILIISLLENKIDSEETLTALTSIPVIGRVPRMKKGKEILNQSSKSSVSMETFRLMRTNLNYLNLNQEKQLLMTTSSMSGEGKSVISINLAYTFALADKKVVLVDLDLRKPKIGTYLSNPFAKGVTNYLTGESNLDEVINTESSLGNLAYITSGPKPPNPAEMLQSEQMERFMEELKSKFDYIILDCPPMGLVADALLLRKYITNTLYVVRNKYTRKGMIKHLEEIHSNDELVRPSIIINDVKLSRGNYGYGGYNSTYGAGYYGEK